MRNDEWRGYTLDEIRFQRVLTLTRLEIEKNKLAKQAQGFMSGNKIEPSNLVGRMASALNIFDYTMIAFTLGRRIYKLFHRH